MLLLTDTVQLQCE